MWAESATQGGTALPGGEVLTHLSRGREEGLQGRRTPLSQRQ